MPSVQTGMLKNNRKLLLPERFFTAFSPKRSIFTVVSVIMMMMHWFLEVFFHITLMR